MMARALLYKRAEEEMLRRISRADWPAGMRLGNEFQLAREFKVSQGTMRRALMALEAEGLLDRKPGRGTVVADRKAARPVSTRRGKAAAGASAGAVFRGRDGAPASFEVHRAKSAARPTAEDEADLFGASSVLILERLLKLGGTRAALEELVIPSDRVGRLSEDASTDLPEALAALGLRPQSIEDQLSAEVTSMGDSVALSCDRNTALLCLTRVAKDKAGQVIARQVIKVAKPDLVYG